MVDARLPDGSRVNAIIKPLALDGPHLSIRKFRRDALSAEDLLRYESASEPMIESPVGICFDGTWAEAETVRLTHSAAAPVKLFQFIDVLLRV